MRGAAELGKPAIRELPAKGRHFHGEGEPAELFDQLARHSVLADATSELPADVRDVNEAELLTWARKTYTL